jgi:hypothetical protein
MVWKNITANELDWSWEASHDGGKTWQVQWPIHYKSKQLIRLILRDYLCNRG